MRPNLIVILMCVTSGIAGDLNTGIGFTPKEMGNSMTNEGSVVPAQHKRRSVKEKARPGQAKLC